MKRPNILLFLTDDHGAWALGCAGNSEIRTPNIDRLAAEGTYFPNAFTPNPVCSPARACLMTGLTPSQVGIHDWLYEHDPAIANIDWLANQVTLPELMAGAGYYCGLSGKWHLGQSHRVPDGFSWGFGLPGDQGLHEGSYTYHLNGEPLTLDGNKSGIITDYALKFLSSAPDDRPFFLNIGYVATHCPWQEDTHDGSVTALYSDATFADLANFGPLPAAFLNNPQANCQRSADDPRTYQVGYYGAVTEIDREVGRLLDYLETTGKLNDTVVVYVSDHGCSLGHGGYFGKGNGTKPLNMFDPSLRVPLVMRWPEKICAGQEVTNSVDHYDLFCALCAWGGVTVPRERDYPGMSLAPLAEGQPICWDDACFGEYGNVRSVRTAAYKLVQRNGAGPDELYNLLDDPNETTNCFENSSFAAVAANLSNRIQSFYSKYESAGKSGLNVATIPSHNKHEEWRP